MASDNEASCVSDPNFAVICSFLEKFGSACGITSPDFLELQEMLENTQEVSPELIDLHIKLLRKVRRSVSGDRWERALIKLCHSYCSQDAWELERFGYKKARLSSKLQILKKLLEMQFDANPKFKAEINRLTAAELRTDPIGRDKHGHAYWYQVDEHCQVRVYREDVDEETWLLVAKDRDGLVRLISQLASNDPNIGDLVLNEDSSSLSIEKPITDTGQTSSAASNCEVEIDELSAGNEIDESSAGNEVDESSAGNELDESSAGNEVDESSVCIEDSKESITDTVEQRKIMADEPISLVEAKSELTRNELSNTEMKSSFDVTRKSEFLVNVKEDSVTASIREEKDTSGEVTGMDLSMVQSSSVISTNKSVDLSNKRKKSINELAVNLRIKTHDQLCKPAVQEQEIDLSMKKSKVTLPVFSSLSVPPYEPSFLERSLRIPTEYQDSEEELDDEEDEFDDSDEIELPSHIKRPRLDRPTLLGNTRKQPDSELDDEYGDEIEEEVMYVRGEGSGRDCDNENVVTPASNNSVNVEVGDVVEESVMYVYGDGSGHDCDAANNGTDDEDKAMAERKTDECTSSTSSTDQTSSRTDSTISEDKCDVNRKCDDVKRTPPASSSLIADSVSSKSSASSEDSCTLTDNQCSDQKDCSRADVNSVCSAIKSDNKSDNTTINTNISDDTITPPVNDTSPDQTVKLPKVGKIVIDVKSVERTPDVNVSPVKKTSRWDVGKPSADATEQFRSGNSGLEPAKIVEHKGEHVLEDSASTKCSITDKLVDNITEKEIVNDVNVTDKSCVAQESIEEVNCLTKGKVQEMVSKWEHAFEENKSNVVIDSEENTNSKNSLITNVEESVKDNDDLLELTNTEQTVSSQKQKFFFGPGCFQFTTVVNSEKMSISPTPEDIRNEIQNDKINSKCIGLDDTLKHANKADNMKVTIDHHVNIKDTIDASLETSNITTELANKTCKSETEHVDSTSALSQHETISEKEENSTIIKDSRHECTDQNIPDEEKCVEAKPSSIKTVTDAESTCTDIPEEDEDTSQTCLDNSTKNLTNTSDILQTTTEEDKHSEKHITTKTTEDRIPEDCNSEIQTKLDPVDVREKQCSDDVDVQSTSMQEHINNDKRDAEVFVENSNSSEVDSSIDDNVLESNKLTDNVEGNMKVTNKEHPTTLEAYIPQPLTDNLQVNTSNEADSESLEKNSDNKNKILSEINTSHSTTEIVQFRTSEEADNSSVEKVLDMKEQTEFETLQTEQLDNTCTVTNIPVQKVSDNEEQTGLDIEQSSKCDKGETSSARDISDNEKCTASETSDISDETASCSALKTVEENNETVSANLPPNISEVDSSCTDLDIDIVDKRTASEISDDTSSLRVETSSVEKDDVDQASSIESMDVSNSSVLEDNDNDIQTVTDISETSMVLSETTQSQISDDHENDFARDSVEGKVQSFAESSGMLQQSRDLEMEDIDIIKRTEILHISELVTENVETTSSAKSEIHLTHADTSSTLLTESSNSSSTIDADIHRYTMSETSRKTAEVPLSTAQSDMSNTTLVPMEDPKTYITSSSSFEQKSTGNEIAPDTVPAVTVSMEKVTLDDTGSVREDVEKKTALTVADNSIVVLTDSIAGKTDIDKISALSESSNTEIMCIEQDDKQEITPEEVDTSVVESASKSVVSGQELLSENTEDTSLVIENQPEQLESSGDTKIEELPKIDSKNLQTTVDSTEENIVETKEESIVKSKEVESSLLEVCDKLDSADMIKEVFQETKQQIPKALESTTDLTELKSSSFNINKEMGRYNSNDDVCPAENLTKAQSLKENIETPQLNPELSLSDDKVKLSQAYINPVKSIIEKSNINITEEHLTKNVDICMNLSKDQKVMEKENVPNLFENILDSETRKISVDQCQKSVYKPDINEENMQTGTQYIKDSNIKRLENLVDTKIVDNASITVSSIDINKIDKENDNKVFQSDTSIKDCTKETNVLIKKVDSFDALTEKAEITAGTAKVITAEKNQFVNIQKNLPEVYKKKEISAMNFEESPIDEFSSDEDMFDSSIMSFNDECDDDEIDDIPRLDERPVVRIINKQSIDALKKDVTGMKSDTALELVKIPLVDEKKKIDLKETMSSISVSHVTEVTDDCKVKMPAEKSIGKVDDDNTDSVSSVKKEYPDTLDLQVDSKNPSDLKASVVQDSAEDDHKPVLMCVDITKLQDKSDLKPVNKAVSELKIQSDISSPRSVETVGVDNEESSDIIDVPETDPLACTEEDMLPEKPEEISRPAVPSLSLATFKLDGTETDSSLIPEPIARALRNRKISMEAAAAKETRKRGRPSVEGEEAESNNSVESKRRRMRGKRSIDVNLRRSVESKHAEVSSSEDESAEKNVAEGSSPSPEAVQRSSGPRRGTGKARRGKGRGKGRTAFASRAPGSPGVQDTDLQSQTSRAENSTTSPVTKTSTSGRKKRRVLGLDIDPSTLMDESKKVEDAETNVRGTGVRQSRRIAQLKIREEAERRKIEELTLTEIKEEQKKKKSKRDEDKDYKADTKKRKQKPVTDEDEDTEDEVVESSEKKSRKKRRKHQDPRKLFNSTNPWQSSSGSSTSNEEEEEDEVEEEPSDEEAVLKSDHEFSPESDLESNAEVQPLRRARTVKKESDTEDPTDVHACQKCGKADHPEWILLCDKCDCGWHCSCLRPALLVIPEGDWFCPPCQHISLVEALKVQLGEYEKRVSRRDMEVRRQERLAYVGISLNNVLPTKEQDANRQHGDEADPEEGSEDDSSNSESSSGSSSGESEPIYQLRERRQAHSYRFNDYDELINSAIQEEIEAVKGAGNQGRGKDIATIVNAEKEEALLGQQPDEQPQVQPEVKAPALEPCPPVVPVYAEKPASEPEEASDRDSEEELRVVPKMTGRKKHRKLNSLDISSEDDPDDDEDFKGTSEDDDEDLDDLGSEDSDDFEVGRRGKGRSGPIRRSTRARTTRYDREFINDDSEDDQPRKKKTRSIWDESESEESDKSWGKRKKGKKQRQPPTPKVIKKTRKKKKRRDDSDPDVPRSRKPKKPKIKFGGLDDSDDDDEMLTRRTRGKKINYIDALGSDSDEDKPAAKRIESEDEYVANEDDDEDQEDVADAAEEKDSDSDSAPPIVPKKLINSKPARGGGRGRGKGGIARTHKPIATPVAALSLSEPRVADDVEDEDGPPPLLGIPVIAANPDDLNEEEVGTMMMENEEYAKKQLELMAIQLAKEKKKKELEAKKREQAEPVQQPPVEPKKRGRKKKVVPAVPAPPVPLNPSLTMSPFAHHTQIASGPKTVMPTALGQGVPLLMQAASPSKLEGLLPPVDITSPVPTVVSELTASPPKRRGRGKGKKTLAAEAANAAAVADASAPLTPTSTSTGSIASGPGLLQSAAGTPSTAANLIGAVMSDVGCVPAASASAAAVVVVSTTHEPSPTNLAVDAPGMHAGKLGIASPPQPFSQSQPAPSVITRMLQSQPMSAQTFTTVANTMNQKYFGGMCDPQQSLPLPPRGPPPPPPPPPPGQFSSIGGRGGRVSSPYRQSPPAGMNLYPGIRPVAPNSPHRLRSPGPLGMQQMFHSAHHPLDPSPSGGGPINITTANRDRHSPAIVSPSTVSSPLASKDGPTPPPPPQYIRGPPMGPGGRFPPNDTSPGPSLPPPVRHHNMPFPQTGGAHMQQPSSPSRAPPPHPGNFSPYHPPPPNYHYGAYPPAPALAAADDALPPTDYQASPYPEAHYSTGEPVVHSSDGSNSKPFDEEGSGEFGGLVSYFSSQREDDLDT